MILKVGQAFGLNGLRYSKHLTGSLAVCQCPVVFQLPNRTYYKSKTEESLDKYTEYEKSFKEWKLVEKLLPPTHVPAPPTDPNVELPSGWRPPSPSVDHCYYIRRTKNHLVPVYEKIECRGLVRHTYISKVEGNIWVNKTYRIFRSRVHDSFMLLIVHSHNKQWSNKTEQDFIASLPSIVWQQLEKDVGRYLQKLREGYPVTTRTHEVSRQIIIKGSYVEEVKQWVIAQGF